MTCIRMAGSWSACTTEPTVTLASHHPGLPLPSLTILQAVAIAFTTAAKSGTLRASAAAA